jgi:hypothetical protein
MSQPDSNQNETSKMRKLLNGNAGDVTSRLPHASGASTPKVSKPIQAVPPTASSPSTPVPKPRRKFLETFWTIASIISLAVNIGVVIALLVVMQMLGGPKATFSLAQDEASGLLGGLYNNFVKMDQASIKTTIHVEKEIPVQFSLNVSGPTDVTLSRDVSISGALVTVNTGGLNINNARANIVLPAGTVLPINIQNLVVPVDQKVLAVLDVPVDIPLNQTELHEPFVGLQKVVEPFYCMLEPLTLVDGIYVCQK